MSAVPALLLVKESESGEQRRRAERIVADIQHRDIRAGLVALAAQENDADMDVEEGMWLIARILDPLIDRAELVQPLDAMAAQVRAQLGAVDPKAVAPAVFVTTLINVLKTENGFRGNVEDYANPDNSSLKRVLATKKGLPILLSHIALAVAERLEVPLVGLGIPGQYMMKYDVPGEQADIVINPFVDWEVLTPGEAIARIPGSHPEKYLQPMLHRATLERMLNNLASHLAGKGKSNESAIVRGYADLFEQPIK
jgi:regulator of sirC expression with transglutaminase-like and TPR domain